MTESPVWNEPLLAHFGWVLPWLWALSNKLFKSQAQVTEDIDPGDTEHMKAGAFKGRSEAHPVPSWLWKNPRRRGQAFGI